MPVDKSVAAMVDSDVMLGHFCFYNSKQVFSVFFYNFFYDITKCSLWLPVDKRVATMVDNWTVM